MISVILAGGIGKRFWPLSTYEHPKQFLKIFPENKSLFDLTYERLKFFKNNKIIAVTKKRYSEFLKNYEILPLFEPFGRNTLGAFVLAVKYLYETENQDQITVFLPSDHMILNEGAFKNDIENAAKTVNSNGISVILGVRPKYPETGYGYIKTSRIVNEKISLYGVKGFKEKPEEQLANYYFNIGGYFWNCGIIITTPEILFEEFKNHNGEVYDILKKYSYREILDNFSFLPNIPIEKAIIEKSRRVAMIEAHFDWTDLGSWESYFKYVKKSFSPELIEVKSKGNHVLTTKKTVLIDVEDLTVIESEDGILIMKNDSYQKLKDINFDDKD